MELKGDQQLIAYIQYKGSKIKLMQDTKAIFKEEDNQEGSMLDLINFEIE
jgi:hypothetical protein